MNQDVTQPAQKGRSQRQKLVLAKFSSDSVTPVTDTVEVNSLSLSFSHLLQSRSVNCLDTKELNYFCIINLTKILNYIIQIS